MPRPKKPYGGPREGAGRPPLDPALKRERVTLYLTMSEAEQVRVFVEEIRRASLPVAKGDKIADSDRPSGEA